jgi:hypothetical protein
MATLLTSLPTACYLTSHDANLNGIERYGNWKAKEAAKEERRKKRQEKQSRGEPLSDWEEDPDREVESEPAIRVILRTIFIILVVVTLSGRFITGSMTWGYTGKWVKWKTYWPFEVRVP